MFNVSMNKDIIYNATNAPLSCQISPADKTPAHVMDSPTANYALQPSLCVALYINIGMRSNKNDIQTILEKLLWENT